MATFTIDASFFPNLDSWQEVVWAPVYISPIAGSPERLVIAVAVAGEKSSLISLAASIEKLHCLYGNSAKLVIIAAKAAISELEADLKKRGKDALFSPINRKSIISVGTARESSTKELRDLAHNWLSAISSLHSKVGELHFECVDEQIPERKKRHSRNQVTRNLFDIARRNNSPVLKFFSPLVRAQKPSALSSATLDFKGNRIVANFAYVRPVDNLRGEFDAISSRLWALDVNQVRAKHKETDAVKYELILKKPDLNLFPKHATQLEAALNELEEQADDKNLILRQIDSEASILKHLEVAERL
jgi:hypothetical protein